MSSLGYAIAFLLCAPESGECETVALRASRFASIAQCHAMIPDALHTAHRARPANGQLTVACRNLDEICGTKVTGSWRSLASNGAPGVLHRVSGQPARDVRVGVQATLALLCQPPREADCSG